MTNAANQNEERINNAKAALEKLAESKPEFELDRATDKEKIEYFREQILLAEQMGHSLDNIWSKLAETGIFSNDYNPSSLSTTWRKVRAASKNQKSPKGKRGSRSKNWEAKADNLKMKEVREPLIAAGTVSTSSKRSLFNNLSQYSTN